MTAFYKASRDLKILMKWKNIFYLQIFCPMLIWVYLYIWFITICCNYSKKKKGSTKRFFLKVHALNIKETIEVVIKLKNHCMHNLFLVRNKWKSFGPSNDLLQQYFIYFQFLVILTKCKQF